MWGLILIAFGILVTTQVPVRIFAFEPSTVKRVRRHFLDIELGALIALQACSLGLAASCHICLQAPHVFADDVFGVWLVQMTGRAILKQASALTVATSVSVLLGASLVDAKEPSSISFQDIAFVGYIGVAPGLMAAACVSVGLIANKTLALQLVCAMLVDKFLGARVGVALVLLTTAFMERCCCAILVIAEDIVGIGPVLVARRASQ